MGRPKTSWAKTHAVLLAVGRGREYRDVAAEVGVSLNTVIRLVSEHGLMCNRERKLRVGSLVLDERVEIELGVARGESFAGIGRRIGRHRQTVWAEVNRHGGRDTYRATRAQDEADRAARRVRAPWIETRPDVWAWVVARLRLRWSPEQISGRLALEHPDDPYWSVSHESIYQAIFIHASGELRAELAGYLRTGRSRRKPRSRATGAAQEVIPNAVSISERPEQIEERLVPGHWEGDLIAGRRNQSHVATTVERTSRYGHLVKLESKSAPHVAQRLGEELAHLPQHLALSLTWDRGREMAAHESFTTATNISVYFADPHSPWQRGTNENWNGLVRQYLPKGTDLSAYTQQQLDEIAAEINNRPRKNLGWKTPAETYNEIVMLTT
jgi:IS30 family transposase